MQVLATLDPYKVLGVEAGASEKEIKKAHRRLVLKHHPDRAKGAETEVRFIAIQEVRCINCLCHEDVRVQVMEEYYQ